MIAYIHYVWMYTYIISMHVCIRLSCFVNLFGLPVPQRTNLPGQPGAYDRFGCESSVF